MPKWVYKDEVLNEPIPLTWGKLALHVLYCGTFLLFVYCVTCVAPSVIPSHSCSPVTAKIATSHK